MSATTSSTNTSKSAPQDALLDHYEQAKAILPSNLPDAPSAHTRERILQAARDNAGASTINSIALDVGNTRANSPKSLEKAPAEAFSGTPAANDSFWNIKAVASLAVMGLSALLWWQFEQGTPEEQQAAKSAQPAPAIATAPAPAPVSTPALTPNSATPSAPVPKITSAPVPSLKSQRAEAEKPRALSQDAQVAAAESAPAIQDLSLAESPASLAEGSKTGGAVPPAVSARSRQVEATSPNAEIQAANKPAPPMPAAPMSAGGARSAAPTALPSYAAPAASETSSTLFLAIEQRNAAALRQTLAQGASPDTRNHTDAPALIIAVMQRWPEGVRLLLEAGADKAAKNNKGQTASDLALELGYADMTELLATSK